MTAPTLSVRCGIGRVTGRGADVRRGRLRMCRSVAAIGRPRYPRPRPGPGTSCACNRGCTPRRPTLGKTMPVTSSDPLPNGLPIVRASIPGTRATTVLVAFDAGARTERPEENGMAHFLEHLVFKGGELYDDYRKVNETAVRMGASLNAYTSHDLVEIGRAHV